MTYRELIEKMQTTYSEFLDNKIVVYTDDGLEYEIKEFLEEDNDFYLLAEQ